MTGKAISHYKILEKLGEGGMGVVYKAEDTKLKRIVALKFLPPEFNRDSEAKERFIHEARAAASLSHPNICTIYEVDESENQLFIAMEYIQGKSLKEKVKTQPLKFRELLDIATQIAEGLKDAHAKSMVHRDIKPANIMLTESGQIKIMDFGLAKLTGQTRLTKEGTTLGTVAYMSPEQARGESVDQRTDIWSLGVVLYEMVSGQIPFKGEYEPAIVYSILNDDPEPLTALRTGVPMDLERIVFKLLAKDPAQRYQHIDELPVDLEAIQSKARDTSGIQMTTSPKRVKEIDSYSISWRVTAFLVFFAIILTWIVMYFWGTQTLSSPYPSARFKLGLPNTAPIRQSSGGSDMALSPDGKRLVYVAYIGFTSQLVLREVNQLEVTPLPETEGAFAPFFSPDGKWIAFNSKSGELQKLYLDGGKPVSICKTNVPLSGSWAVDDTIFYTRDWRSGLWKISANGGEPIRVSIPDSTEFDHWSPEVLPGNDAVLFTIWNTSLKDIQVGVLSRKTGKWHVLVDGAANAKYTQSGHLLYIQSGTLVAAPFDLRTLEVGYPRVPIIQNVNQSPGTGLANYDITPGGMFIYQGAGEWVAKRQIVRVNRQGETEPLPITAAAFDGLALSPNNRRLAFSKFEGGMSNIWVYEFENGRISQLTFEGSNDIPVWSPDGQWLAFRSSRLGPYSIFRIPVDRNSSEEVLLKRPYDQSATSWSPDGKLLLYSMTHPESGSDIGYLSFDDIENPIPLLKTSANNYSAHFHPSGNWIAYMSNESGHLEVYVNAFPGPGAVSQVSTNGGWSPRWSRDGHELYYLIGDKIMAVDVETEPNFWAGTPKEIFTGDYEQAYDVALDGRFLMISRGEDDHASDLIVVLNWFEELKEKLATTEVH
jgi:serine/threonine-protein kinase